MAEVPIPCICAGTPHEQDTIYLREKLGFRAVSAIKYQILIAKGEDPGMSAGEVIGLLSEQYLLSGIEAWTLLDAEAQPIQVNRQSITAEILGRPEVALEIADKADDLYAQTVMLPLLGLGWKSSPDGQSNGSTSATNGSSRKPRKRSKRSSTTTTQTGDIVKISA